VAKQVEVIILRLTVEDGTTGWGEAAPWVVFTGSPEASFAALDRYMRPYVVGQKLSDHEAIFADASRAVVHCTEAKAALDTALYDVTGKLTGMPVWELMGGAAPVAIPLSCSIADPDFEADKTLLERLGDDGVRIVKLKAGFAGPEFDRMRLGYIRRTHPDMAIRVDYNQGLRRDEALDQLPKVARFAPDFIEQPVAAGDWEGMAQLRRLTEIPLLADESVFGPEDMARAIRAEICDGVSVKIMKAGGLRPASETAFLAQNAGLIPYGGDMFETGLGHLAGTHMITATWPITPTVIEDDRSPPPAPPPRPTTNLVLSYW
jgi:muconate cycloisomerase